MLTARLVNRVFVDMRTGERLLSYRQLADSLARGLLVPQALASALAASLARAIASSGFTGLFSLAGVEHLAGRKGAADRFGLREGGIGGLKIG